MKFFALPLLGAYGVELSSFRDDRGSFTRLFSMEELAQAGQSMRMVQVNHSYTKLTGTIRGMHFQYPPKTEAKLIACLHGRVFDVAVDFRKGSKTFLHWHGLELSGDNHLAIYIPEGFAHGFQTLEDDVELIYLHTEYHDPKFEGGFRYDDETLGITWPLAVTKVSPRDLSHQSIKDTAFCGVSI